MYATVGVTAARGVAAVAACSPSEARIGGCAACSPECGESLLCRAVVTASSVVPAPVASPVASTPGLIEVHVALLKHSNLVKRDDQLLEACGQRVHTVWRAPFSQVLCEGARTRVERLLRLVVRQIVMHIAELVHPRRSEREAQSRTPHQALGHV
eukprot:192087-Prymnesium_polylepis.2